MNLDETKNINHTKRGSLRHRHHLHKVEEEIGRCQCKNTVNNIKTTMAPSEPTGATSARTEHPKAEETEEIDFKNEFMKMIEVFKEEMKTTLKEFKEWYVYTMEYYSAEKNNNIMKFTGKWKELENIIVSEVTQTQKDKHGWNLPSSAFCKAGFVDSGPTTNSNLFIVFLLIYLSSVLGNGLIIMLICLDTQLHIPMYFVLCILAMLDISYVTTTMPQMLVHLLAHSHTISFAGCWMQMYVFGSLGMTEGTFFVVTAYDRYVAICYPLCYTVILNWGLCIRFAAGTCVLGFLSGLLHTFFTMSLPYCGPNKVNHYLCDGPAVRSLSCMDTHIIEMVDQILSVFMGLIPISSL
ncbi:hypothetical protein STEG23_035096 [Scotinomys teguina]